MKAIINQLFDFLERGAGPGDGTRRRGRKDQFVTDADQVVGTLRESDGYTWQADIANELDWTESKTSRRLSDMERDDLIVRYRVGRRKVVCLPEREPRELEINQ